MPPRRLAAEEESSRSAAGLPSTPRDRSTVPLNAPPLRQAGTTATTGSLRSPPLDSPSLSSGRRPTFADNRPITTAATTDPNNPDNLSWNTIFPRGRNSSQGDTSMTATQGDSASASSGTEPPLTENPSESSTIRRSNTPIPPRMIEVSTHSPESEQRDSSRIEAREEPASLTAAAERIQNLTSSRPQSPRRPIPAPLTLLAYNALTPEEQEDYEVTSDFSGGTLWNNEEEQLEYRQEMAVKLLKAIALFRGEGYNIPTIYSSPHDNSQWVNHVGALTRLTTFNEVLDISTTPATILYLPKNGNIKDIRDALREAQPTYRIPSPFALPDKPGSHYKKYMEQEDAGLFALLLTVEYEAQVAVAILNKKPGMDPLFLNWVRDPPIKYAGPIWKDTPMGFYRGYRNELIPRRILPLSAIKEDSSWMNERTARNTDQTTSSNQENLPPDAAARGRIGRYVSQEPSALLIEAAPTAHTFTAAGVPGGGGSNDPSNPWLNPSLPPRYPFVPQHPPLSGSPPQGPPRRSGGGGGGGGNGGGGGGAGGQPGGGGGGIPHGRAGGAAPNPGGQPGAQVAPPIQPPNPQGVGFQFDLKLKLDAVPEWDGNMNDLLSWLEQVDQIAEISPDINQYLGYVVPMRLKGPAKLWWTRLAPNIRMATQQDWPTLRQALCRYFMTSEWLEQQQQNVLRMRYRQKGHEHEKPIDYYYRKLMALELVYDFNEQHFISELLSRTPDHWRSEERR